MKNRLAIALAVFMPFGLVGGVQAQTVVNEKLSESEEAAVAVVLDWVEGWANKNPQQVYDAMEEDAFWAGGFPDNPLLGIWRSAERFVQQDGRAVSGGVLFTVDEVLAVGGPAGTAVLYRRPDESGFGEYQALGGGSGEGVFFVNSVLKWVVDGKIRVWLDAPVLFPPVPRQEAPPLDSWDAEGEAGLQIVQDFLAAWESGSAEATAAFLDENVQFSTYYPEHITEVGVGHFVESRREAIEAGIDMEIGDNLAIGGPQGTAVLVERTDTFELEGEQVQTQAAAFFWVRDGKIHTWLDFPLDTPPSDASGAAVVR